MKKFLLLLTMLILGIGNALAEDYSQGYYTMGPGAGGYCGFYSSSNANSKYGGTSTQKSYVVFTFEKTGQENVYYWYDCNNHKYIYADVSGYLQVADSKATDNDNYKWFIKDDGNGNLTITDMTNYNNGNPTKGLVQLESVGGWWASKCTFTQNSGRNTWKLNLLIKKNHPYYIGLQRAADRYLQYGSNKIQQAAVTNKGVTNIWYFTDGGDGKVNIHAFTNMTAMGYASNAVAGEDKIATSNTVKDFYIRLTNNSSYPLAFLTNLNLYLSNNGGTTYTNMGLYGGIDDSGTRMKVEDASGFFSASQTVNLVSSDITVPYSGGAGTSESRVSISHNGGSATLTGADKTYYLSGSYNATQTTVTFDGTTVNYNDELGVGIATYNIHNTQVTTPKFITSQGGNNRPAVVNLTGNTVITVTGNTNEDTNQSSIMIGHWNGSSNLTLNNTAKIEAVDAQLLVGKTGNTQTITLNGNSNITAKGIKASANASGTNTLNLNGGSLTLGEYGITSYSSSRTISVNVTENSTITASASTLPITQSITIAAGKTLTIDGDGNTVDLESAAAPTLGTGSSIEFIDATVTLNVNERDLSVYTFTDCTATAKFIETGAEYAAGGFTITNVPSSVTIKVKKYGTTDYETVTPVYGTATISHSVGVSGSAAWLDYTFNETTLATNKPVSAITYVPNRGNAGNGQKLTIDNSQSSAVSYNEDGTFKVRYTPYQNVTWPENYTVAVSGNFPDVENGCLVAFGTKSANYLALIRGANSNEIKLVKGKGANAYTNIQTMAAENATAAAHLVVFTKQGNVFKVYCDGVNVATTEYDQTLGGGLQVGSIHGGYADTGIASVMDNSLTDDQKNAVFCNAIRVYDYIISDTQMEDLKREFPYLSQGGNYTRTISADANLDAEDAWYNVGEETNTNLPTNNVVEEVTYYPDIVITTTAASTLTVNANMDSRNIEFNGAGKLTIVSDGTHNISIKGSVTANGPISVKYGETDFSAVPVSIGESGSVEFDFSASASNFSDVTTSTDYPVTGNTSNYGSKVTALYPSDDNHTYSLAFNGTTNSYYLTVGPTVKLKQDLAIALVAPYYNGKKVGTAIGKYTISLGETSYANMKDFLDAITAWESLGDCIEPTITLNTPSAGFYRLKNVATNGYLRTITATRNYTSTVKGVKADGTATEASTVIKLELYDNHLYMYNQGYEFGWTISDKSNYSGGVGYVRDSAHDKYVNWFPGTDGGQIAFAICYGNGTGDYASYLTKGIYTTDTDDDAVIAGDDFTVDEAQWVVEEATSVTVSLNNGGDGYYYATLCLPFDVTLNAAAAYTLTMNSSKTGLTLSEAMSEISAGTPVFIRHNEGTLTATIGTGYATTPSTSTSLTGCYVSTDVDANTVYTLGKENVHIGFYKYSGTSIAANRAYVSSSVVDEVPARGFVLDFGELTGISNVESQKESNIIYDMQGRRVQKAGKGLYIVNGKKVLY